MSERKISDSDVEAIAEAINEKMMERFYTNIGKGVWAWARKIIITAILVTAAYGAAKGYETNRWVPRE